MTVYHGSSVVVERPDVLHSYRPLDFGKGFYVTTVEEQAERWARRKKIFWEAPERLSIDMICPHNMMD